MNPEARKRLVFALDESDMEKAAAWVDLLKDRVGMFKIGKEAFTSLGPRIVESVIRKGGGVFLDLKFHDIPNTAAGAARAAVKLGASIFNVHALGGKEMMKSAADAALQEAERISVRPPLVLAVTVLTSLGDEEVRSIGFDYPASELAVRLAVLARESGLSGVVASAREIDSIRKACGRDFVILTPGIRWGEAVKSDDQKRVLGPAEAIRSGADFLVVGRPISRAKDPAAAADAVCREIETALSGNKN